MLKKVIKKQPNSKNCFVCGRENEASMKASFYEMEDKSVIALAIAKPIHQSYPNIVHGGVSTALLDETMGRAIMPYMPHMLGVTVEMTTKFKKTVPYDVQLVVTTCIKENGPKIYICEGQIILPDGETAVTAVGKFFRMDAESLEALGGKEDMMMLYPEPDDPAEIEIPERNND